MIRFRIEVGWVKTMRTGGDTNRLDNDNAVSILAV